MNRFAQGIVSTDRINVQPERVHEIMADPDLLAKLTPLVQKITTDGDRWRWQLVGINALGLSIAPAFLSVMDIGEECITFRPDPHASEMATASGELSVTADGPAHTSLAIDLVATIDLPVPKMMGAAVRRVMFETMKVGGARFADHLLRHLGDPPHSGLNIRAVESSRAA